jgi:enoyl-CoA hydratase/carnithine racemase
MADEVELSIQGEVAFVRLRRPEQLNAMRGIMFDQLRKVAQKLEDHPPQFVVLVGEGQHFCAGLDRDPTDPLLAMFQQHARQRDANGAQQLLSRLRLSFDALARVNCPVIAAVEGKCHGVGLELALVADLRVVAENASLRYDDGRYGVLPGLGGLVRGMRWLGPARMNEAVLTSTPIPVQEARQLGLINRISSSGGALSSALELVQEMRKVAPMTRKQTLLALRAIAKPSQEQLENEVGAAVRTWIAAEWPSALQAVKEGREPSW